VTELQHEHAHEPEGECLDPEVAARYLDGTLSESERDAVERHLVECDECRELVTSSLAVQQMLEAEEAEASSSGAPPADAAGSGTAGSDAAGSGPVGSGPAGSGTAGSGTAGSSADSGSGPASGPGSATLRPTVRPWRGRWLAAGTALVGIAAAVLFTVRATMDRSESRLPAGATADSRAVSSSTSNLARILPQGIGSELLQKLVAATSTTRRFAARPAGGFLHAPLRGVMRSGSTRSDIDPEVTIAAAQIEMLAEHDHSQPVQALLGTARLLNAQTEAAIETLEQADRAGPPSAVIANDLAAAYLVHGDERGDQKAYARALQSATRAIALDPQLLEARFNRALAAERLNGKDALALWQEYVQHDPSSPWADEAKGHISDLAGSH
jgi:hypothetical protein